jgi:hypothetical protein
MTQLPETKAKLGRKRDHTRDPEILDAALEVLAETGYDGMTIDRWASKGELVIDAVACMKQIDPDAIPDTGTLRGDLVAMIKPHALHDAEKKLRIMGALTSMLARDPQLADAAYAAIVEPRASVNRMLLQRAIDRGEIAADTDIETISLVSQAMATYRTIMLRKPVDREFLISVIDGVLMPALGLAKPKG